MNRIKIIYDRVESIQNCLVINLLCTVTTEGLMVKFKFHVTNKLTN